MKIEEIKKVEKLANTLMSEWNKAKSRTAEIEVLVKIIEKNDPVDVAEAVRITIRMAMKTAEERTKSEIKEIVDVISNLDGAAGMRGSGISNNN